MPDELINSSEPVRLSMWSGPRNISTAMMRSFGNRPGCSPIDEPFYAYYLVQTGLPHPMREEVIASQPRDWQSVVESLTTVPLPTGSDLQYIKHMTHHILPEIDLSWLAHHRHCFLIRDPRLVIASYAAKWDQISTDDIGIKRQVELFETVREITGEIPAVVEAEDILRDPETQLKRLCEKLALSWTPAMLTWPAGRREEDGVWAEHWYASVEASTGFAPYSPKNISLSPAHEELRQEQMPYYEKLKAHKI